MRLTAIKLAGFKSFVDPTTINFKHNLTGVVGPNGCGKSNIIDAVRWVMGESSAKQLRGESMSDVIFNGSNARKPVGTASVELVFDNSSGRAGGEYASFSEISVRRQVSRDNASGYFLNGTRCRRKDITDLFLGTGMGPRSYSIIEQGMISQVVEARPEELRQHLEEAAGISKYRERRRETENRIRHTRENLSRLNDLREEVNKQLSKLKRQANAAERYKTLQAERRELQANLLANDWRELQQQQGNGKSAQSELQTKLEQAHAAQRHAEAGIELLRDQQGKAQDHSNTIQGELYQIGGKIAQTEQSIQHQRELRQRQEQELQELQAQIERNKKMHGEDQQRIEELSSSLADSEPRLQDLHNDHKSLQDKFEQQEQQLQQQQQALAEHNQTSSKHSQQVEVARTRINNLDEQLGRDMQQITRLREQQQQHQTDKLEIQLGEQQQVVESSSKTLSELDNQQQRQRQALATSRDKLQALQQQQQQLQQSHSADQGRLHSLQALQQAALGEEDNDTVGWLQSQSLADNPRVAESISSDSEWSNAVETVLGDYLQAVVVDAPASLVQDLASAVDAEQHSGLTLIAADNAMSRGSRGLAQHVTAPQVILERLSTIRCVDSLSAALALLPDLSPAESVITAAGEWLGAGWVRVHRSSNPMAGSLARQQSIRDLEQAITAQVEQLQTLGDMLEVARTERAELEEQLEQTRQQHNQAHHQHSAAQAASSNLENRIQAATQRQAQLTEELQQIQQRVSEHESGSGEIRSELQGLLDTMSSQEQQREKLQQQLQQTQQQRDQLRQQMRDKAGVVRSLEIQVESSRASLESARQAFKRSDEQAQQAQQRHQELDTLLKSASEPGTAERQSLDELLKLQLESEQRQKDARVRLDELVSQLQETDRERQQSVRNAEELREQVEQAKLKQQSLQLRCDNLEEQLSRLHPDARMSELVEQIPDELDADAAREQLEKLSTRIERMEPVNLAAIGEYDQEQERKTYLDNQNDDLEQALETLEKAIARIDRTTRTRFKETFEQVKVGMETLFPRLFGGGHAYLELTGDDLLTTGVTIMARPPGKRVSSIHLLSGGEKALTAVAFVFAIFSLNPAPFCMLDEVDAPLDDANVSRFSALVKEMSDSVQFIMVTHNKVTMEKTDQLCGVTMREAGVSRMVSVDIKQAAELAAS